MTNQHSSSQNRNSPNPKVALEVVLKMVEASPFRELLRLPPEEVLDFFHSRVGQALVAGLSELKRRALDDLMSSTMAHDDVCDKLFEVRGIESVCQAIIDLPREVKRYVEATRHGVEKDVR